MKKRKNVLFPVVAMFCLVLCAVIVLPTKQVCAESTDIYQVNGKYTLTTKKLVTKCQLETADASLKKKTRTYKVTSKTKIQRVNDDYSKTTLKGSKRKKMIKKLNKKNETIQFKAKNGKVVFIWFGF